MKYRRAHAKQAGESPFYMKQNILLIDRTQNQPTPIIFGENPRQFLKQIDMKIRNQAKGYKVVGKSHQEIQISRRPDPRESPLEHEQVPILISQIGHQNINEKGEEISLPKIQKTAS